MYIKRSLSKAVLKASQSFKVLLLTGPRQVGKTTLLKTLQKNRSYISLDDKDVCIAANEDPAGFIDRLKLPVLIDEVQYAPNLFSYIKLIVDKTKKNGLFWLTGSQEFSMMKNISESLAGRIAILDLQGISLSEDEGRPQTPPFIPTLDCLKHRQKIAKPLSLEDIYFKIWRGSYPHVVLNNGKTWQTFYESYVTTYIERDVRDYLKIDNLIAFRKFMQIAASRTGQMLKYRDISKEIGVSQPTIKSWFNVLQATGIIKLIHPYFNNMTKRLLKTPKLYFMDTGLCCFLTRWINPEVLEKGAMAGPILETYVISEIIKSYIHNGLSASFYYYADKEKNETDLLIEQNGCLYPIEIKKSASIHSSSFKGFNHLTKLKTPIDHGCILCFQKNLLSYNRNIDIVPISYI